MGWAFRGFPRVESDDEVEGDVQVDGNEHEEHTDEDEERADENEHVAMLDINGHDSVDEEDDVEDGQAELRQEEDGGLDDNDREKSRDLHNYQQCMQEPRDEEESVDGVVEYGDQPVDTAEPYGDEHETEFGELSTVFDANEIAAQPTKLKIKPPKVLSPTKLHYMATPSLELNYAKLTDELARKGIDPARMAEKGWGDDHIKLHHKIAMRGLEPLMPRDFRDDFSYLPKILFGDDREAAIKSVSSTRSGRGGAYIFLRPIMSIGGLIRSSDSVGRSHEQEVVRRLRTYTWRVQREAGVDPNQAIPMLTFWAQPSGGNVDAMARKIQAKMAKLHQKYHYELVSRRTPPRRRPGSVPQIYGLIATGYHILLVAYRPDDTRLPVHVVAKFDYHDPLHDVWSNLALAIVVNHCRDIQLRLAQSEGLGLMEDYTVIERDL
ncbi:hypothetical protein K470DRAFT_294538 [Piedraia hortae CBS 480.64]|uniref:Uncharacterized protein n=1 Tax=Piedraia hortae CBS 480.64 TaxID=1314780 RepID=A0A6A7C1W5_9PEZI|nr:hypothetical protein K470DRAFT_294538 [Piedraia hortae CBS 480.64]